MASPQSSDNTASSGPIDLRTVRRLFSEPARIRESDFLRREIAHRMHERLSLIKLQPREVLDLGCGEGADMTGLQTQYPESRVIGVDASSALLREARRHREQAMSSMQRLFSKWLPSRGGAGYAAQLICGDFARLALQSGSADLVWSNLALHWHPQPDLVFSEWRRVLRVDGLLMFSCFGPDTFREIRDAFAGIDEAAHAFSFVDMHDFGDMLVNAGFSTPVMDMEKITVTYDSADRLLADVRAWGGNPLLTRRRGLLGRHAYARMLQTLEDRRNAEGKIPLTFEVVYGHAFRPAPRTTSSGEAIIRFDPRRKP
ncbi:methyltransferase domain-containing protein [Noviherbaspirillum aerium]|uniref:methyltransferase domain-containing protein n=1 Tax=Noviherbaspirillum aerium TaxID=2588497 RepID=UPI00384BE6EF